MSQTTIELKGGSFTLSVLYIHNASPEAIRRVIQEKIEKAPELLKNAPVILNVTGMSQEITWHQIIRVVTDSGLYIVGVSGCNNSKLKQQIIRSGLPLLNEGKTQKWNTPSSVVPLAISTATKTRIISSPVRSGQQIYARNCDLVVTSSVSAGAELIADGNIHVYGIMRGRALAGASGDGECQIFCTHIFPELVSLAGQYWLTDQIPVEYLGKAVRLSLQNDTLTIHSLI